MDFTNMETEQLNERLEELRSIGNEPGERTAEELEKLAEERQAIDAEIENRKKKAAADELRREKWPTARSEETS